MLGVSRIICRELWAVEDAVVSCGVIVLGPQAKTTDLERGSVLIGIDEGVPLGSFSVNASEFVRSVESREVDPCVLVGVAAEVL